MEADAVSGLPAGHVHPLGCLGYLVSCTIQKS